MALLVPYAGRVTTIRKSFDALADCGVGGVAGAYGRSNRPRSEPLSLRSGSCATALPAQTVASETKRAVLASSVMARSPFLLGRRGTGWSAESVRGVAQ